MVFYQMDVSEYQYNFFLRKINGKIYHQYQYVFLKCVNEARDRAVRQNDEIDVSNIRNAELAVTSNLDDW